MAAVASEHRVYGADAEGIGTVRGGVACQRLEGQGIAQPAIARAAQPIQLHRQAPGIGSDIFDTRAGVRSDRQGHAPPGEFQLVIARRGDRGQACLLIQSSVLAAPVFQHQFVAGAGFGVAAEVEGYTLVQRQQGR